MKAVDLKFLGPGLSAQQRLQELCVRVVLWQTHKAAQLMLEVLEAACLPVVFYRALRWSSGIVTAKELQVRVRGEAQVHVTAERIVQRGGESVGDNLKVLNKVPRLVCVLVEVTCRRVPAELVCDSEAPGWSCVVSCCGLRGGATAPLLPLFSYLPQVVA